MQDFIYFHLPVFDVFPYFLFQSNSKQSRNLPSVRQVNHSASTKNSRGNVCRAKYPVRCRAVLGRLPTNRPYRINPVRPTHFSFHVVPGSFFFLFPRLPGSTASCDMEFPLALAVS